jgi:hypothetical protein
VILGAAFCPHPPALVPDLALGASDELNAVRTACADAIRQVAIHGGQLVLLGADVSSTSHSPLCRGSFAGFGVPMEVHLGAPTCGGQLDLPLSLTVGAWLVREYLGPRSGSRAFSIGPDFAASRAAIELLALAESEDIALLVMGDGSARRSTSAPGYLDDRAAGFDATVTAALAAGDAGALSDLDPLLGDALLSASVPVWRAAAGLMEGIGFDATLLLDVAPYGVGYFVAAWTSRA